MCYQTITMRELEEYLDGGEDMLLIDLRDRASFSCCHLKAAVNIPYEELETQVEGLPQNRLLTFYCYRGGQSMLACNHLSAYGYRVMNIANGLSAYQGKYLERSQNLH
ncbi:MAG: rhodanese-like domain-containing protein [Hungatella sp.]